MKKPDKKDKKNKKAKKAGEQGADKKPSFIGKLLMPVILAITSFCTVYFLPRETATIENVVEIAEHKISEPEEKQQMAYINMEPFTVSLKDRTRILRLSLALEIPESFAEEIDPKDPKLRDAFMGYLSALGMEQVEDASFLIRLRDQLTRRAQFVLGADNVQTILITDFMVR